MGDVHQVVVDDVCEIVGRVAVGFQEHLILQLAVFHRDGAVYRVLKGGGAGKRHLLADDVGNALRKQAVNFLLREVAAVAVVPAEAAVLMEGIKPLLGTEAIVGLALLHQLFGVGLVQILALALHIGTEAAVAVGALVVLQADLL